MYQSIEAALAAAQPDDLLRAFLSAFNELVRQLDDTAEQNNALQQQLTERDQQYEVLSMVATGQLERLAIAEATSAELKLKTTEQAAHITELSSTLSKQNTMLKKMEAALANAEQLKTTIEAQRKQLQEYNALNPQKLKEQIKRVKDSNDELTARNTRLTREREAEQRSHSETKVMLNEAHQKLILLRKELALNSGAGLFHNGEHHLIVWPQMTKMQAANGEEFTCRSLLYMHQSGRAALIAYDPEKGASLSASPKGGLKPNQDTLAFAQNWLYRVNELQKGIIYDADMLPVNHNIPPSTD